MVVFPFEFAISSLHDGLKAVGVQEAYGPSIIAFTIGALPTSMPCTPAVLLPWECLPSNRWHESGALSRVGVKALTFPLTKTQIESTTKMQAIAPAAKALQDKYRERDPARLNSELQKLYADNQVNPLAGCVPALAQIPLFIGLYRSLLNLATEDRLNEPFLFLPSLEGPVRSYTEGNGWLFSAFTGNPQLGWHDTLAYLVLPVVLVLSQYASTTLLTPKTDDPAQQQSQARTPHCPPRPLSPLPPTPAAPPPRPHRRPPGLSAAFS